MRKIALLSLIVGVVSLGSLAQVSISVLGHAATPDDVIAWLQRSTFPAAEKEIWLRILPAAFSQDLVSPAVALGFFQHLLGTPHQFVSEVTALMEGLISQGLPVGHLMNKVSQGIAMGRAWDVIVNEVRLRAAVLTAVHKVLAPYAPPASAKASVRISIGPLSISTKTPTWLDLEVEVAEAVSDFIAGGGDINDWEGMESFVRTRLLQLRGRGLPPDLVDQALGILSPEIMGKVVSQVFQIERR